MVSSLVTIIILTALVRAAPGAVNCTGECMHKDLTHVLVHYGRGWINRGARSVWRQANLALPFNCRGQSISCNWCTVVRHDPHLRRSDLGLDGMMAGFDVSSASLMPKNFYKVCFVTEGTKKVNCGMFYHRVFHVRISQKDGHCWFLFMSKQDVFRVHNKYNKCRGSCTNCLNNAFLQDRSQAPGTFYMFLCVIVFYRV